MKTNRKFCRIAVTLGLITTLTACVILPIPMPSKTQASYFDRDDLSFIRKGKTSKAEIREQLGNPNREFEDPSKWVYTLRRYSGNRWAVCIFVGGPGYGDGDCGMTSEGKTKYKILEIEFDERDLVAKKNVSSIADGKCTRGGVCRETNGFVAEATLDDEDASNVMASE